MIQLLAASTSLTIGDLAILGSIGGAVVVAVKFLIGMGDRLWGVKPKEVAVVSQTHECQRDHTNIQNLLVQQNAHISKLLEHMGQFLHASELRHEATISQLKLHHAEVLERLKNIFHQMPKRRRDEENE